MLIASLEFSTHPMPTTKALTVHQPRPALDFSRIKALVLNSVTSEHSRAAYDRALTDFLTWFTAAPGREFTKATVQEWVSSLEAQGLAPATINLRLSAIRKLATEAGDNGLMDPNLAQGIRRSRGVKSAGVRTGNWLSREQAEALLTAPRADKLIGKRDRAALGVLLGCGLRRSEVSALSFRHIQQRDGRWVIVDLVGKGKRIRSVPMPAWAKMLIDDYVQMAAGAAMPEDAALVAAGWPAPGARVFRPMNNRGAFTGEIWLPQNIMGMVAGHGRRTGLDIKPHDLRRTFAKLAHKGRAALEQIQLSLGHASITTTEKYLGVRQDLQDAPCDHLGLRVGD